MSYITGVGLTSYGKHEGLTSLDLMSKAAELAVSDAGLKRSEVDGILCGYSTVSPHIMLATVFAEHFGIKPSYAHAVQVGAALPAEFEIFADLNTASWTEHSHSSFYLRQSVSRRSREATGSGKCAVVSSVTLAPLDGAALATS